MISILFGMQFLLGAFGEKGTHETLMIERERALIYEQKERNHVLNWQLRIRYGFCSVGYIQ
jgi:hypothetical protein